MKLRLLPTLVGLAIGFAATALAEEQSTVNPEVRQQIEAELAKFDDAFNNDDAAAIVSLFTPDAIEVWGWDKSLRAAFGRHAVERRYILRETIPEKFSNKLVQVYPIGDGICAISELDDPHLKRKDYVVTIYIREANEWKIRMRYVH
jgi:ketosteroid isomerase-like protein